MPIISYQYHLLLKNILAPVSDILILFSDVWKHEYDQQVSFSPLYLLLVALLTVVSENELLWHFPHIFLLHD